MKLLLLSILLLLLLLSCSKEPDQVFRPLPAGVENPFELKNIVVYHILQGNHYCQETGIHSSSSHQIIYFKFYQDCWYNQYDQGTNTGENKLWGFGDLSNLTNSLRISWRCWDKVNRFALSLYAYVNSQRVIIPMDTINPNQSCYAELWWEASKQNYIIKIDNRIANCYQPNQPNNQYQLYPYFGGNSTAPHNMEFSINSIQ